jgi:hypothetical protein
VALKIGAVLLVLGILHDVNVAVLNAFRRHARVDARTLATLEPPRRPGTRGV